MVVIVGLAVLLSQDLRFVDRASPEAVADYFMESWVAGDGEAAAAMFSAEGGFGSPAPGMIPGGLMPDELPALHDWYRAMGWGWEGRGCGALRYTFVSCAYRYENKLTRAVGAEPVTGSFLLTMNDNGIETVKNEFGYYEGWDMFLDWASTIHPDDLERMYDGAFALLDQASLVLWEQHTDEFHDELDDNPEALAEWKAQSVASLEPTPSVPESWLPEEYIVEVARVCTVTNERFETAMAEFDLTGTWSLEELAAWGYAAARFSEEGLANLRALPAHEGDIPRLEDVFSVMEQQTNLLSQMAAAASAGDATLAENLSMERVEMTHLKDGLGGPEFWNCPVSLPA